MKKTYYPKSKEISAARKSKVTASRHMYIIDLAGAEQFEMTGADATDALKNWFNEIGGQEDYEEYNSDESYLTVYDSEGDICNVDWLEVLEFASELFGYTFDDDEYDI